MHPVYVDYLALSRQYGDSRLLTHTVDRAYIRKVKHNSYLERARVFAIRRSGSSVRHEGYEFLMILRISR